MTTLLDKLKSIREPQKVSFRGRQLTVVPIGFGIYNNTLLPVFQVLDATGPSATQVVVEDADLVRDVD